MNDLDFKLPVSKLCFSPIIVKFAVNMEKYYLIPNVILLKSSLENRRFMFDVPWLGGVKINRLTLSA